MVEAQMPEVADWADDPLARVWSRLEMEAEIYSEDDSDQCAATAVRDGFSEAIQLLDQLTGGDGEYRYCTDRDPERHCPTPIEMGHRIITRQDRLRELARVNNDLARHNAADRATLLARNAALMEALDLFRSFGCPVCNGDCASANPPVMSCPMQVAEQALRGLALAGRGEES